MNARAFAILTSDFDFPVQLPAYPNARPSSLYGGGAGGVVGVPSTPSSPFNGRGPTPDGAGYSRPASVYHTHTSSSSDRCSTPDKDVDVKNGENRLRISASSFLLSLYLFFGIL